MRAEPCIIPLNSMTFAMKGEALLRERGIPSRIVRLPREMTVHGCGFGLSLACGSLYAARRLLAAAGIPMGELRSFSGHRRGG